MKLYIQIIAAGVAVVYVVGLWTSGIDLDSNWLRYYSIAVVILTVFWGCWDWWLWRAPFINCIRSLPPALGGTWQGTLRSSWDAPSGQELGSERVVYLVGASNLQQYPRPIANGRVGIEIIIGIG